MIICFDISDEMGISAISIVMLKKHITHFDLISLLYFGLGVNELCFYVLNVHSGYSIFLEEIYYLLDCDCLFH